MDETESFQSQLERNLNERIIELFEHPYYELVITSSTLTFLACLLGTGLNVRLAHAMRFERILVLQGTYIALFGAEITCMASFSESLQHATISDFFCFCYRM